MPLNTAYMLFLPHCFTDVQNLLCCVLNVTEIVAIQPNLMEYGVIEYCCKTKEEGG